MRQSITALFLTVLASALPLSARADLYCPAHTSIFGTVASVGNETMTIRTTSHFGYIHVIMHRPLTNSHGLTLRPGVFVGVYGCLQNDARAFDSTELTLANSAQEYAAYDRTPRSIDGRITAVQNGRINVTNEDGHGSMWIATSQGGLRPGDRVHVTGTYDPISGGFTATTVNVVR
jgi:hypothetical protein